MSHGLRKPLRALIDGNAVMAIPMLPARPFAGFNFILNAIRIPNLRSPTPATAWLLSSRLLGAARLEKHTEGVSMMDDE